MQMRRDGKAEIKVRGIRRDGSVFHKEVVLVRTGDSQRHFAGHYCFMKDITEQKLIEDHSRRQLERLFALHRVDLAIISSLDLRVTLDIFLEQTTRLLEMDAAAVLRINPHTTR
jgi:hypothetical protein